VVPSKPSARDITIAFHEAGHAVAAFVLGIGYLLEAIGVVIDEDGRGPGVELSGDAFPSGCPATQKPEDVSDDEWEILKNSPATWNQWIERDHEKFAIYYLAGEAAQLRHSPESLKEVHKTDYSHVKRLVPDDRIPRLKEAAEDLIAGNWSHVELVAAELTRCGRVTGAQVKALLAPRLSP
jgi:hypothetical protein